MTLDSFAERRRKFRAVLQRRAVTNTGSVFDAASARLAQAAGYQIGIFAGSIASAVVLGAPDLVVLTLSEFAEQARRIGRGSDLPLLVDADDGYGNALNVRRTVTELEAAGVAALTIEDTSLPRRYGARETEFISREEFRDKLLAALDARSEPELLIVGRLASLTRLGLEEAVERVRICDRAGVDAVFLLGVSSREELAALHAATSRPLILTSAPLPADELVAGGVRVVLQGNLNYYVMLRALYDSYVHLVKGGTAAELQALALTPEQQAIALAEADYARWAKDYLAGQ